MTDEEEVITIRMGVIEPQFYEPFYVELGPHTLRFSPDVRIETDAEPSSPEPPTPVAVRIRTEDGEVLWKRGAD